MNDNSRKDMRSQQEVDMQKNNIASEHANTERRSEQRLDESVTIFVERYAADFDNSRPASIVVCKSIDISANGLQVRLDQAIPIGTILRLCAQFRSGKQSLYVVGEVKWQKQEDDLYCIGFALFDSEQTDIIAWKELIAGRMSGGITDN